MIDHKSFLFLDIDVVLATGKSVKPDKSNWFDNHAYPFDPECVNVLNYILRITNAKIIITSDWRFLYELDEMCDIFKFNKIIKSSKGYTTMLIDRNDEITDFVNRKRISKFVIIDDLNLDCYKSRLIVTIPDQGLQISHADKIFKLLE